MKKLYISALTWMIIGLSAGLFYRTYAQQITISNTKWFNLFFWHYTAGLAITCTMLLVTGIMQINGAASTGMTAGIAGIGHILLTVGLGFFFAALGKKLPR